MPDVQFIFAGTGPLEDEIKGISNIKNVGFQNGEKLENLSVRLDFRFIHLSGMRIAHSL